LRKGDEFPASLRRGVHGAEGKGSAPAVLRDRPPLQLLEVCVRWGPRAPQPIGVDLSTAEHAQQVFAGELAQIGIAPATPNELGEERRVLGYIFQPLHQVLVRLSAVEVGANADVVDPRDFADVLDVVRDVFYRGAWCRTLLRQILPTQPLPLAVGRRARETRE